MVAGIAIESGFNFGDISLEFVKGDGRVNKFVEHQDGKDYD
ncbi:hypothetical protein [Mucilaginibacter sp.]|nr:hypothetical protein [Mucilaginibacter sp.]MDB4920142.1 hypothetical protein [Mucilaginibacter sp.]